MLVVSSLSRDVFDTRHCLLFDVTGLAAFSCLLFPAGFLVLPSRFVVSSYCPVRGLSQLAVSRMMLVGLMVAITAAAVVVPAAGAVGQPRRPSGGRQADEGGRAARPNSATA